MHPAGPQVRLHLVPCPQVLLGVRGRGLWGWRWRWRWRGHASGSGWGWWTLWDHRQRGCAHYWGSSHQGVGVVGQLPARSSHGGDTATHPESPQAGTLVTRPRLFVVAVRAQALAQQRCPQSARLHRDAVWTLCVVVAVSWPLVLWRAPSPLVGPSPLSFLFFSVVHFLSFMSWCALACSTLSSFKLPAPPTRWCRVIRPACMHAPTPLRAQGGTGRVGVGACFTTSTLPVASLRPGPLVPPFVNRRHLTPLLPACVAHPLPPTPTSTPFFLVARTSVLFHCPVWVFFCV